MKVLLVEDLASVRAHLRELLADVGQVELLIAPQDFEAAMRIVLDSKAEAVILDMCMRGSMTIDMMRAIKAASPTTAVIVGTFYCQPFYRETFLSLGADFFFDKSLEWDELIEFLKALGGGQPFASETAAS